MKKIASAFLLFAFLLPFYAFAGGKYHVCKNAPEEIKLDFLNPKIELQLRPDCLSGEIVVADYVLDFGYVFAGHGELRCLCQINVTMVDGVEIKVERGKKLRLRGDGKITIFVTKYAGIEI